MLKSVKLACIHAQCREHPVRWRLIKVATTTIVLGSFFAPDEWRLHATVAANLFWIWVEA